jgi:transposase
LAGV